MTIKFYCNNLINHKNLIAFIFSLLSFNAYADLEVCNKSQKYSISIALAFQRNTLFENGSYEVSGWNEISPQKCTVLLKGDAKSGNDNDGYRFWLHAVSNGIVLVDHGTSADIKEYSNKQLCVSSDKFSYEGRGDGVTQNCSKKKYLAPFAISLIPFNDDPVANLYPDEVIKNNPNGNPNSIPRLPDLHGALAISSTGHYITTFLTDNIQQATSETIDLCKSNEPEATCKIIKTFKNQCISVSKAKGKPAVIFLGSPKSTKQDVIDSAQKKCISQGNSACKEQITVCSTYEEKTVRQKENKDKLTAQVVGVTAEVLKEIFAPPKPKLKTGPDPWDKWKTGDRTRPSNYDDSPPECGKAYDESMECAHKYDGRGNAWAKSTLDKGGACYPLAHLAELCGGTDTEQFETYKKELEEIQKGKLVYEQSHYVGDSPIFTYRNAPKNMKFPIPNSEPLQFEKEGFYIQLVRDEVGLLIQANLRKPHQLGLGPDFNDSNLLECDYNAKEVGLMDQYYFWYKKTPAILPSLKIENVPNHPLQRIGKANSQCPGTIDGLHKLAPGLKQFSSGLE